MARLIMPLITRDHSFRKNEFGCFFLIFLNFFSILTIRFYTARLIMPLITEDHPFRRTSLILILKLNDKRQTVYFDCIYMCCLSTMCNCVIKCLNHISVVEKETSRF